MEYVIKVIWENGETDTFTSRNLDSANAMKSSLLIRGGFASMEASW